MYQYVWIRVAHTPHILLFFPLRFPRFLTSFWVLDLLITSIRVDSRWHSLCECDVCVGGPLFSVDVFYFLFYLLTFFFFFLKKIFYVAQFGLKLVMQLRVMTSTTDLLAFLSQMLDLCDVQNWTQSLVHTRLTLYQLSYIPSQVLKSIRELREVKVTSFLY